LLHGSKGREAQALKAERRRLQRQRGAGSKEGREQRGAGSKPLKAEAERRRHSHRHQVFVDADAGVVAADAGNQIDVPVSRYISATIHQPSAFRRYQPI
jgi:hypothetical protein